MDDQYDDEYRPIGTLTSIGVLLAVAYGYLWLTFPWIAAAISAMAFVLGVGLVMTKLVFRLEGVIVWVLTPLFGGAWLVLFWLLWKLQNVL